MVTTPTQLAEQFVNLTVKEIQELSKILKEKHGIEPAATAPVVIAGANDQEATKEQEKTSFNVIIKSPGSSKLNVIKAVKEITGKSLTESKALVDNLNKPLLAEKVSKEEAQGYKVKLEEAGATVVFD